MASVQWIHCNLCYYLLSRKDRKFYTTSCLHVICKKCTINSNRGTMCPVCQRQGIRFAEICNSMDSKIKNMFNPSPATVLESAINTMNFQYKQKQHLINQIIAAEEKTAKLNQVEQRFKQKIAECQQKYQKLRNYRKNLMDQQSSPEFCAQSERSSKASPQFFDSPMSSGGSKASNRDSFLNMKGASTSSGSHRSEGSGDQRKMDQFAFPRSREQMDRQQHPRHSVVFSDGHSSRSSTGFQRDSFLNMKGASMSSGSNRSANFGTTPSSGGNSTCNISELLHGMALDR
ncbi:RING finger protein vilya [Sabethes cyaneus]|uniref:RING finger protein vilya n=1 Tax=Sabethes cyaneus TaxID=53552 RepID=UPI00237D4B23|nr:RING finger protein vilya [Sabethes cyaneus]